MVLYIIWRKMAEGGAAFNADESDIKEIRIVLVGKTGTGKSKTGNTILNQEAFESKLSCESITRRCAAVEAIRFGKSVLVVDTPGIFDTSVECRETRLEIYNCIGLTSPGPHAFLITISLAVRFTTDEMKAIQIISEIFPGNFYNYAFIAFTNGEYLKWNGTSVDDYLKNLPDCLKIIIDSCSGRFVVFENSRESDEREESVKKLITHIETNIRNKPQMPYYTNKVYDEAEKILQRRERDLKKASNYNEHALRKISRKHIQGSDSFSIELDKVITGLAVIAGGILIGGFTLLRYLKT